MFIGTTTNSARLAKPPKKQDPNSIIPAADERRSRQRITLGLPGKLCSVKSLTVHISRKPSNFDSKETSLVLQLLLQLSPWLIAASDIPFGPSFVAVPLFCKLWLQSICSRAKFSMNATFTQQPVRQGHKHTESMDSELSFFDPSTSSTTDSWVSVSRFQIQDSS